MTPAEWVLAGAFALMPLCAAALSIYTTRVFVDRYTLWALTGAAVLVAALLCRAARGRPVIGVSVLGLLVALMARQEAGELSKGPVLRAGEAIHGELATLADGPEPVVIADHHAFMELAYYAAPRLRERLIYPVSRELDLRYFGVDTGPLLMTALSRRTKLRIVGHDGYDGYDAVLAAHPRFLLAARPWDYLPWHLVRAGYRVVPMNGSNPPVVYAVEAPAH